MISVEIRNFQSISHAVIEVSGFTALSGRSNIGKSAIVRAVEAALTGAAGTSFVRHGPNCLRRIKGKTCKCFASVHLTGDNFDLLWEKGDGVNRYRYNGVDYDAVSRGCPEFLRHDFTPVKVGDSPTLLQIAPQWDSLFLLNATGGVVADVLADVAELDCINVASRNAERDRKASLASIKVRKEDVDSLKSSLLSYVGLDVDLDQVKVVEKALGELEVLNQKVVLLNRYLLEYTALSDQVAQLEVAVTVVPPEVQPLKDQSQIAQDLTSYLAKLTALVTQVRALETATAGETPAITPLVEQSQAKQKLANFSEAYISKAQIVEALTEADLLVAPSPNLLVEQATATQKLAGWSSKVTGLKASLQQWLAIKDQVIPETTPLDGFANVGKLVAFASKLQKAQISVEGVEAQYTEILATEAKVQVEVQGLGTCPTCTRPFHLGGHT